MGECIMHSLQVWNGDKLLILNAQVCSELWSTFSRLGECFGFGVAELRHQQHEWFEFCIEEIVWTFWQLTVIFPSSMSFLCPFVYIIVFLSGSFISWALCLLILRGNNQIECKGFMLAKLTLTCELSKSVSIYHILSIKVFLSCVSQQ